MSLEPNPRPVQDFFEVGKPRVRPAQHRDLVEGSPSRWRRVSSPTSQPFSAATVEKPRTTGALPAAERGS